MKILEQALNKINGIRKAQTNFILILVQGLVGVTGKRTFRNMARFMGIEEHTFSRQMAKTFDFVKLNLQLILNFKKKNEICIAAQDDTFIPKSGKKTHGLNFFWNGSSSKAEKGLELNVIAVIKIDGEKYGQVLLFSTDTKLEALKIYQFYVARFQIEFIFRDAKGFAGLADCQSTEVKRLDFHFNTSLLAVNIIRLQDAQLQQEQKINQPFSIMNWHRQYYVEIVLNRFIAMFDLSRDAIKSHPDYQNMLGFGNVKY